VRRAIAAAAGEGTSVEDVSVDLWAGAAIDVSIRPPRAGGRTAEEVHAALVGATPASLSVALEEAFREGGAALSAARGSGGPMHVGEIRQPPSLVSPRTDAIFKVCAHGAWLEQNTRDWDGSQGGTLTGTAWGYKHSMQEDLDIVNRHSELMGFDEE